jgi:hypothetical protein
MKLDLNLPRAPFSPLDQEGCCPECGSYALTARVDERGEYVVGCKDCLRACADADRRSAWSYFAPIEPGSERDTHELAARSLAHASLAVQGVPEGERAKIVREKLGHQHLQRRQAER